MSLVHEIDYGTPRATGAEHGHAHHRRRRRHACPPAPRSCAPRRMAGTAIPKLCATDMLDAFGSCRLCLVEIDGRAGTPASCTTPVARRHGGPHPDRPAEAPPQGRDGALHLRSPARLPDLLGQRRLRIAGHGRRRRPARRPLRLRRRQSSRRRRATSRNPYFTFDPAKCIVCSRCVRACEEVQGTFALTIAGRGFGSVVVAGHGGRASSPPNASPAAPASRPARPRRCNEKSVIEIGTPERSVITTCAYCGVGCSFNAEMRGDEVVRMVPYKDGKANHGHSCVKGRFAWGYATHRDRILKPMIRDKITDPWREVSWDEAIAHTAVRVQAHPGDIRPRRDRRHHLLALHQRGDLPRPEAGPRRLRQQQRRHLRPRLPFADRLRPEDHLRHVGRHAGFRFGRAVRRRSSSSAPTRPTAIRSSPRA